MSLVDCTKKQVTLSNVTNELDSSPEVTHMQTHKQTHTHYAPQVLKSTSDELVHRISSPGTLFLMKIPSGWSKAIYSTGASF